MHPFPQFFAMDTCTHGTPVDRLDTLSRAGYTACNWNLCDPAELRTALKEAQARNIEIVSVYGHADLDAEGLHVDPRALDALDLLEGREAFLWLPIASKANANSSEAGDELAARGLEALCARAAKRGLRIALYPHTGMWLERIQDAVRLAELVAVRNLGVTFNLCHCLMLGDETMAPALLKQALPWLTTVTINGADADAAHTDWRRLIQPLGIGSYKLEQLVTMLHNSQYSGPIGLQGYGLAGDDAENLALSMLAWRERYAPIFQRS